MHANPLFQRPTIDPHPLPTWIYVLACLIIPAVWGLAASWVFDRIQSRRAEQPASKGEGADMYHI